MLSVCFLWHMHQPYYVDPSTQTAVMPWVRLHAVKGYWDMVCLIEEFPEMRAAFNLTPVLVRQINELVDGSVRDEWLEWSRVPAGELTEDQRVHLLENFFKINWDNLVRPYPRYWQLLNKRGMEIRGVDLRKAGKQWSEGDFRDLQVWFNLAWCGYKAVAHYPELRELAAKGEGFTEADKVTVLRVHGEILRRVLPKYRELAEKGQIELTTTPFFHPIMPLVYDTDFAKRCMPRTPLPPRFTHPEDVREHLRMAVEQHEAVFGSRPRGLWPSEGSVCPELIPLLREVGIEWFGTDEEVLFRSLAQAGVQQEPGKERVAIYQGYQVEHGGAAIAAAFRDRSLSDFVGFSASRNSPQIAADFLVGHLQRIAEVADKQHGLAPVILDGENAWEYFADGGESFLRELYRSLSGRKEMIPRTFTEYFAEHKPSARITTLHTGSWIRADFDIWIGDPEENRAWELLGQARRHLEEQGSKVTDEARRKALWEIYAAEGSDWFWWYGPDFHNDSDHMFDLLFRRHLENVYRTLGTRPPDVLKKRIRQIGLRMHIEYPKGLLQPTIDGRVTSFFEWYEAGRYDVAKNQSTMFRGDRVLQAIYFGFDLETVYLRFDLDRKSKQDGVRLRVHFVEPKYRMIEIQCGKELNCSLAESLDGGITFQAPAKIDTVKQGDVIEVAIPTDKLAVKHGERACFFVEEFRDAVELGSHPENGLIAMRLPSSDFEMENWQV